MKSQKTWLVLVLAVCLVPCLRADSMTTYFGTSSGVFINPILEPNPVVNGVGTSTISWGSPIAPSPQSSLTFQGTSFTTVGSKTFIIGWITYFNGTQTLGTGIDGVQLDFSVFNTGPVNFDESIISNMVVVTTPNDGDPLKDADYVYFSDTFSNRFHVLEGQTATAPILATLTGDPQVQILGFGKPLGGGFVTPEPGSLGLIGIGVGALLLIRRLRRRPGMKVA